jgi:methylenetetrahydrofolate dehydrogenase (NADP+)/methenyltetrahydrofolate cyclohydrolase
MVIDGKLIAENIYESCKLIPRRDAFLAIVSVSPSPAIASFMKQKKIAAERLEIDIHEYRFDGSATQDEVLEKINELSRDAHCGGIILQLPLPPHMDKNELIGAIVPQKDVDNLSGNAPVLPPAVGTVEGILKFRHIDISTYRHIAVVGQGDLVGKPVAEWAQQKGFSVSVYDKGFNPDDLKTADLVVSGAGSSRIFSPEHLKEGAMVIDFGYGAGENGKPQGDFNPVFAEATTGKSLADEKRIMYTPTPGGTGPVLVACLMKNFCILNYSSTNYE